MPGEGLEIRRARKICYSFLFFFSFYALLQSFRCHSLLVVRLPSVHCCCFVLHPQEENWLRPIDCIREIPQSLAHLKSEHDLALAVDFVVDSIGTRPPLSHVSVKSWQQSPRKAQVSWHEHISSGRALPSQSWTGNCVSDSSQWFGRLLATSGELHCAGCGAHSGVDVAGGVMTVHTAM